MIIGTKITIYLKVMEPTIPVSPQENREEIDANEISNYEII